MKITRKQSKAVFINNNSKFDSTTSKKGPIIASGPVITINVVVSYLSINLVWSLSPFSNFK